MRKRFLSEEQKMLMNTQKLYDNQKLKMFDYNIDDFEIIKSRDGKHDHFWKHKTWKTYVMGTKRIWTTKNMIRKYIDECKKPYSERNLDFIHLV